MLYLLSTQWPFLYTVLMLFFAVQRSWRHCQMPDGSSKLSISSVQKWHSSVSPKLSYQRISWVRKVKHANFLLSSVESNRNVFYNLKRLRLQWKSRSKFSALDQNEIQRQISCDKHAIWKNWVNIHIFILSNIESGKQSYKSQIF